MDPLTFSTFMLIGLAAGMAGGLLGIGGSAIFIPAASLVITPDQQIYQAAAMILNVFVAASATLKHWRSRAIDFAIVRTMVPFAVVAVIVGVYVSNHVDGSTLARGFGAMLIALGFFELGSLATRYVTKRGNAARTTGPATTELRSPVKGRGPYRVVGAAMGGLGGLLGIGGGIVGVPLLRFVARQPLRGSIAAAAAVTLPLAAVGAIYKNLALPHLPGEDASSSIEAILIASAIVPTAIVGSWFGAAMVQRLPIDAIRIAFAILLLFAGLRMTTREIPPEAHRGPTATASEDQPPGVSVPPPHRPSGPSTMPKIGNSAS